MLYRGRMTKNVALSKYLWTWMLLNSTTTAERAEQMIIHSSPKNLQFHSIQYLPHRITMSKTESEVGLEVTSQLAGSETEYTRRCRREDRSETAALKNILSNLLDPFLLFIQLTESCPNSDLSMWCEMPVDYDLQKLAQNSKAGGLVKVQDDLSLPWLLWKSARKKNQVYYVTDLT